MLNLKRVSNILETIATCQGMNAKIAILNMCKDDEEFKKVVRAIYNPYSKTGISDNKLEKASVDRGLDTILDTEYIIEYFKRHQTGRRQDANLAATYVHQVATGLGNTPFMAKVARGIVTNDLQIGVNVTTFNKVFGKDFIPKISCMLGKPYEDVAATSRGIEWPCVVTEKLDGVRRILIKQGGACHMYSRAGHEDTGLVDIIEEATKYLPDNMVYDGELLAKGMYSDSIALRQATNSIAAQSGNRHGVTYNVFDMLPVDAFFGRESSFNALTRKVLLACTFGDEEGAKLLCDALDFNNFDNLYASNHIEAELQYIRVVPILGYCRSLVEVEPIARAIWDLGGEGVMLNTSKGLYETKRSSALLKVKHVEEWTLKIVGFEEGSGKFEGMLGAMVLEHGNNIVKVGTGFTDDQRMFFWAHKEEFLGKYAEIECFGQSTNKNGGSSLSCPVFKRIKGVIE